MPQESFLREDTLNWLILAVILTQDEIKDDICAASGQIDELGEEMREMRILNKNSKHNLRSWEEKMSRWKRKLRACSIVIGVSRPRYTEQEKLVHELFADNLSPKSIIEHPFNEDLGRKHQFPWDLLGSL